MMDSALRTVDFNVVVTVIPTQDKVTLQMCSCQSVSDVLGVEAFLLSPTESGGDGDGPRCFFGISLKTPDEFP
jgi:hypothetical protein